MTDFLTRGFRAQLTTAMDSVLKKALVDIMAIFEISLHDHQMVIVQKGEEIAHLKIRLQTAELKLKEGVAGGADVEVEKRKKEKPLKKAQKESEVVLKPSGQNPDVPEIDFEVPDDWCAPLGCETTTKQDEDVCPSVRLRPLLIPLWRIPVIKQEVTNSDIDTHQQGPVLRKSKRGTPLNERHKGTRDKGIQKRNQTTRRKPVRSDIRRLLCDIKEEYSSQKDGMCLRGRGKIVPRQRQKHTMKRRSTESVITVTESKPGEQKTEEDNAKKYCCKYCSEVFDTPFGRDAHSRSHKTCKGCKTVFPYPSVLRSHKWSCEKLKSLLKKKPECTNPSQPESHNKENPTLKNKKQLHYSKERLPSSGDKPSIPNSKRTTLNSCVFCSKRFPKQSKLLEHMRIHTGEKPFPCPICPKRFRIKHKCKMHVLRIHKKQIDSAELNEDFAWTKPLEDTEDKDLPDSPSRDSNHTVNHNHDKEHHNQVGKLKYLWKAKGAHGFSCLSCQKFVKTKRAIREHIRLHTGERPIKCEDCQAKFRTDQQLYIHKKRMHYPDAPSVTDQKKAPPKSKHNKHKDWPNACKVCGKGFVTKGHLRNHMERWHNEASA